MKISLCVEVVKSSEVEGRQESGVGSRRLSRIVESEAVGSRLAVCHVSSKVEKSKVVVCREKSGIESFRKPSCRRIQQNLGVRVGLVFCTGSSWPQSTGDGGHNGSYIQYIHGIN